MNTSYKPGKKTPNLKKKKVIFQDLNGKTVVALRCHGAHWDCMWLMHRIRGDFSIRELGRVLHILLLFFLLFFVPYHSPPFRLRSSGERAGGDAAGDHMVWALFWGCPLALKRPVCAAQLPSPLFVRGCDLYACGP